MRQACLKRKKAKGDGVPWAEMSEDRPGREHRVYTSLTVEEKTHKPRHSLGEGGGLDRKSLVGSAVDIRLPHKW